MSQELSAADLDVRDHHGLRILPADEPTAESNGDTIHFTGWPEPKLTLESPPCELVARPRYVEGWACPQCGADVRILTISTEGIASADGSVEQVGDMEFFDHTPARCVACAWSGMAGEAIGLPPVQDLDATGRA